MDIVIRNCQEEVKRKLLQLQSFQRSLENALEALVVVEENYAVINLPDSEEQLLEYLLKKAIKETKIKENAVEKGDKEIAVKEKTVVGDNEEKSVKENAVEKEDKDRADLVAKPEVNVEGNDKSGIDEFIENLLTTSGGKKGVKYQVEVKSPLYKDGTFWACHIETGFIQEKLEPLSLKLRVATQKDRSLWGVTDMSRMVCVKSSINGLWMRAMVVKEQSESTVTIRLVDVGKTEDCPKSRLMLVPKHLAAIPYMAFSCTFFKRPVQLDYQVTWRFSDLTKKKILNFTVEDIVSREVGSFLYGRLETIIDEPAVNITKEIVEMDNFCHFEGPKKAVRFDQQLFCEMGALNYALPLSKVCPQNQENPSILSRDIRVIDGNAKGLTSKTEVIRTTHHPSVPEKQEAIKISTSKKLSEIQNITSGNEREGTKDNLEKEPKVSLTPIKIPSQEELDNTSNGKVNWGDCDTPGPNDHMVEELPLLDEALFDSPSQSVTENESKEKSKDSHFAGTVENIPDETLKYDKPTQFAPQYVEKDSVDNATIQKSATELMSQQQQQQQERPSLPTIQQPQQQQQQQPSLPTPQQQQDLPPPSQYQQPQQQQKCEQQLPQPLTSVEVLKDEQILRSQLAWLIQQQNDLIKDPVKLKEQSKLFDTINQEILTIKSRLSVSQPFSNVQQQHFHNQQNMMNQSVEHFQNQQPADMFRLPLNNFELKLQQLHAITRCLEMPSNILDKNEMENLKKRKEMIEKELLLEQTEREYMKQLQHLTELKEKQSSQKIFYLQQQQQQQQLQQQPINQHVQQEQQLKDPQHPQIHSFQHHQSHLQQQHDVSQSQTGISKFPNPPQTSNLISINREQNSSDSKTNETRNQNSSRANNLERTADNRRPYINSIEQAQHNKTSAKRKMDFEIPSLDNLKTESQQDWISRELLNLTHKHFEDPNVRFFSLLSSEKQPGKFVPYLVPTYRTGYLWLTDKDADHFKESWKHVNGPLFIICTHKPYSTRETWRIGGILQVKSKVTETPPAKKTKQYNYQCQIKFVSTSTIPLPSKSPIRDKYTKKEIQQDSARSLIMDIIEKLQQGQCQNLCKYQETKVIQSQETPYEVIEKSNSNNSLHWNQPKTQSPTKTRFSIEHEENWDLDIANETIVKSSSSLDYGSDDESERNLKNEIEVFGLEE